jgi:hypothetical protein
MWLLASARPLFLALPIVLVAACSELYVERQFRFISIGMSEERMAKLFGPPWYEVVSFDSGQSRSWIHFHHGRVESIDYVNGEKLESGVSFIRGAVNYIGDKDRSPYNSSSIRLGMTHAEVDDVLRGKVPTEDCKTYTGDARAEYYICFKNRRVISKELKNVPPV